MGDLAGLLISYAFVFSFIAIANLLNARANVSDYITRKIVHIGVSNWWIIAIFTIKNPVMASIGPISFIFINFLSHRHGLFPGMESKDRSNLGTVYFPVSLLILVLLSYCGIIPFYAAGIGVLTMGYGDGLAGLFGKIFGKSGTKPFGNKTMRGSFVMFAASFLVSFFILALFTSVWSSLLVSAEVGISATIIEMVTPFGIDNLTVPILTALLSVAFMNSDIFLFFSVLVNFAFALLSYKKKAVDESGFLAGFVMGTIMLVSSWVSYIILMTFFVSASAAGRIGKKKKSFLEKVNEKGDRRDYVQVLANGGVGMIASVLYLLTENPLFLIAAAISFAESNADTWASEIGVLSKRDPVSIIGLKPLKPGLSGGVSLLGLFSSIAGALTVAAVFSLSTFGEFGGKSPEIFLLVTAAGFAGSLIDSFIGAAFEAKYITQDGAIVENRITLGRRNAFHSGFKAVNNDMVNFLSCLASTVLFTLAAFLII